MTLEGYGDIVLAESADETLKYLNTDGGEEFIAVLPDTDIKRATIIAESMRSNVSALRIEHDGNPPSRKVTISLDVASTISGSGKITS